MKHAWILLFVIAATMLVGCQQGLKYVGTWRQGADPNHGGVLNCTVKQVKDGVYKAHFHGHCGRAYSYKLSLDGQQQGETVVFEGVADLGQQDGQYSWTGKLTGGTFDGEFENEKGGAGVFSMIRDQSK